MREIKIRDLKLIYGGNSVSDAATTGAALGGAASLSQGNSLGLTGNALSQRVGNGAARGGGLGAAFMGGYAIGEWLNENTPIQSVISGMLPEPTGLSYCGGGY